MLIWLATVITEFSEKDREKWNEKRNNKRDFEKGKGETQGKTSEAVVAVVTVMG